MFRRKRINSIIEKRIKNKLNKLSNSINQQTKNIKHDFAKRGLLTSGVFIETAMDSISNEIKEACEKLIDEIEMLQSELNIDFSRRDFDFIKDTTIESFDKYIDFVLEKYFWNEVFKIAGIDTLKSNFEFRETTFKDSINSLISEKVDEIKVKRKVKKDPGAVRQVKLSNMISMIALIISVISIVITFMKK